MFRSYIGLFLLTVLILPVAEAAGGVERVNDATGDVVVATTSTMRGRASITLKGDDAESRVTVGSEFRHEATQAAVKAEWIKYPLPNQPDGTFRLMAGETATFEVSGEFVDPGVYESFIEVVGKTGNSRYPVRITRTIKAIANDFLLVPKPLHIDLSFPSIVTAVSYPIRLTARNALSEPVEVGQPIVGQLLSGTPNATVQAATPEAPAVDNRCLRYVPAGQSCVFDVKLPQGLAPGSYSLEVLVPGKGGGQSAQTVNVDVRASAWLAGIVIALGTLLGAAVTDWRTARPIISRRIEAGRLREEMLKLAEMSVQGSVRRRATQLASELMVLDTEILSGADLTTTVGEYKSLLGLLLRADRMLKAAEQPEGVRDKIFGPLAQRLSAALDAIDWKRETVVAAAETLGAELSGFEALYQAAHRFDEIVGKLAPALAYLGASVDRADWNTYLDRRNDAFVPIEPDGDGKQSAARAKALSDAIDKLEKMAPTLAQNVFDKLDADIAKALPAALTDEIKNELLGLQEQVKEQRSTTRAEGAIDVAVKLSDRFVGLRGLENADSAITLPTLLGPDSGLKLVLPSGAFQPAQGASPRMLRSSLRVWDWITNTITLAGIASAGVMLLWMTNNSWGSVQDILLALLAGAGTRLSIGKIGQA